MADAGPHEEAPEPPPEPGSLPASLVDGKLERTDHLIAQRRTPDRALCPCCDRPLHIRTGHFYPLRLFHDASPCLLNTLEGQRHLLARFALRDSLSSCVSLHAAQRCERCGLQAGRRRLLDRGTQGALFSGRCMERPRPSADEPDVLLLQGEEPVLALDVYLSEALETERAERRRRCGIPWLLLDPEAALALPSRGFLPTVLDESDRPSWTCAPCASGLGHVEFDDAERLRRLRHGRGIQQALWAVARERGQIRRHEERVAAEVARLPKVCPFTAEQLRIASHLLHNPPETPFPELPPMGPPTCPKPVRICKPDEQLIRRVHLALAEDRAAVQAREARAAAVSLAVQQRAAPGRVA